MIALLVAVGGAGPAGLFYGAFSRPHAFGGRDGQGAAGLAALFLLVAAAAAALGFVLALVLGGRLRSRGWPRARRVTVVLPLAAALAGILLGRLG